MDQKKETLFHTFPPIHTSEWEARIIEDLKGADYQKKLIWRTPDGINVKPYYRAEDTQNMETINLQPAEYPYVRGLSAANNDWGIRQDIETDDQQQANMLAKDAIARGANEIGLVATEIENEANLVTLLEGICLTDTALHFGASTSYPELVKILAAHVKSSKTNQENVKGSFDFDPISFLLINGDFWQSESYDLSQVATMVKLGKAELPGMKVINVNAHYFNSGGATLVQELAFGLAMGSEYLTIATEAGLKVDDVAPRMMFSFGIGSNYFMEIARLRAARLLWAKIAEQFSPSNPKSMQMCIHSNTSSWNKTLYDPYVNILRTTTEAMSAILGGTNSLSILPFDTFYKDPDEFSNRIARNQQIILKEEAYLGKVIDPAAGSYYIENLTQSIAEAAWKLFLEIEDMGGILKAIKTGWIQDEVEKSANQRREDVANRRLILLGTNQYPNTSEEMLGKINFSEEEEMLEEEMYADDDTEVEESEEEVTTYKKMVLFGASDDFDQMRLATEQYKEEKGNIPSVFLLNIGNVAMRKARAMFISNFFGCAGFNIIDNVGFATPELGVKAALESKAQIIVICSSDEEYGSLGTECASQIKASDSSRIVVVAGYPKEILDSLKQAGVDEFVHVRSNLLETLENFQEKLEII